MPVMTGRCLCRGVRYEVAAQPLLVPYCHCESCRRQTGSPVALFVIVPAQAVRFSAGTPAIYRSSPGVERAFCSGCGTPIFYRHADRPALLDLFAGALDDVAAIRPDRHVHAQERLAWFDVHDALPRYATGSSAQDPMGFGPAAPTATQGSAP